MLEVAMQTTIKSLHKKGYSQAYIARTLGVSRNTVSKVIKSEERGEEQLIKKPYPSILDEFKEFIEIQLNKGLSKQRIYQDLVRDYNFKGSYTAVKDYSRKLLSTTQKVYMVMTSLPGEEAQVDYGYVGTIKVDGKPRKAWVFIMALSYSRYMYASIVFDQSVKSFIQSHVEAFHFFGGVPETVKIDNLKAAVVEADFYEPVLQRTYASFAAHYGFYAQPCRIYTPTDKGKVESNVKYVKDNCFKGRDFKDIKDAREFLSRWLTETANKRIHGTIKKIPLELFETAEKPKLLKLPQEDFIFSKTAQATVHPNCHVAYGGNYYSVPYAYIGCEVDVIEINNLVKVFYKNEEIALHNLCKDSKGDHITNTEHYPESKNITTEEILSRQETEMKQIGSYALEFFYAFCRKGLISKYLYHNISGVLALRKNYADSVIDQACRRALYYNSITYGTVKKICERGLIMLPVDDGIVDDEITNNKTEIARDLAYYDQLTNLGVIEHE
jgi:transposase